MKSSRKLVCLMLCTILAFTGCSENQPSSTNEESSQTDLVAETTEKPSGETTGNTDPEEEPFVPVLRIAVTSDLHINKTSSKEAQRLKKLFESAYKYAGENEYYKTVDALVVAGDLTNNGTASELTALMQVINDNIREETAPIIVMGNHDLNVGGTDVYKQYVDTEINKNVVINGFHIIGISPDNDKKSYTSSKTWLEDALATAAKEDPDKPIFTFQHHHIKDTVYVSSEWYTPSSDMLKSAYGKYSQVINFSGHSHGPINNPSSIWQDDFTCLGTGTLTYFEMTSEMTYGSKPPNNPNAAQYYIVEVDANNKVKIMPYNILTDDFFKTPSNTDGADEQLVYYIDTPSDSSTFRYTNRASSADVPYFGADAKINVIEVTGDSAIIAFPQAFDDDCIYSYEIVFNSSKGNKTFKYFSEYYFEPMPEFLSFRFTGLNSEANYTVSVYPVDCYGKKGEPLTAPLNISEQEEIVYKSKNPVNFTGTFTNFDSLDNLTLATNTFSYGGNINGDVFVGDWETANLNTNSKAFLEAGKGYQGSSALAVWSGDKANQGLYIFATEQNGNTQLYPDLTYLRVWVDFTGVDFRKANFGLVSAYGGLFTTDENVGSKNLPFWYMADGTNEWMEYKHGDDGCFGDKQSSSVKNFKGWLAFPVKDFLYRSGTGTVSESSGTAFHYNKVAGIYMFWDYSDNGTYTGKKFYIDELQIVPDYRVFENYEN